MSMDFDRFCFNVLFAKPTAVVLSTCIGVAGCGWPISCSIWRIGRDSCALVKVAPISTLAAEARTLFRMREMTYIALLCAHAAGFGVTEDR